ncbi:MAG: FHA domain-containing protein [Bacteroidales bacterium]|nr:FHA domain-containing protein [Bacteroidales bacterium]
MKEITIGKLPDNNIVIDNPKVSRHHAKIVMDKLGIYTLVDLQSTNGSYVNGRKVKGSQTIKPGDRIMLANAPITANWAALMEQTPDSDAKPAPVVQPSTPTRTMPPSSVLYDFDKDVDALFSIHSGRLKQIIADFKSMQLPIRRRFTVRHFSEDVLDLLIERYDFVGIQLSTFLKKLERECAAFQAEYDSDMKKLDITYQYRLSNSANDDELANGLSEVDNRRGEMKRNYEAMSKSVMPMVSSLMGEYYTSNPPLFTERMALAPADSPIWKTLVRQDDEVQKTFYMGEEVGRYAILQETVELKKRVYVQSLYGGNLIYKYSKKQRSLCFDVVNTLIGRMLAAAPNGNMRIVMVDLNEMEGTSSTFKALNKNIYKVVSRYDEFVTLLNAEVSRTESIIQNLLQGDITNIAEYNHNKTEKVAYNIWVLKDIPVGYGNDLGTRLSKIVRGGPRAGVSVIALIDDDEVSRSEEAQKNFQQFQNVLNVDSCETYDFTRADDAESLKSSSRVLYESFPDSIISSIVRKVNKGLETKEETILKFTEYMLPKNDWWTGQSANRIDLPFGLTKEMRTTALQITQESGQNTAVVIGIPGSGKSVFLHTIIASAITRYSPVELQVYLLDFSGVEFNVYAKHKLPHARVIAPEAEREFGLSILREVFEEGNRRMALCRENGVTNIVELKRVNSELIVPRLLIIIDEFQKIFEIENDNISKDANAKIHAIIQEYRKFGINLILATQKLPAKSTVPYDLIANRVVFKSDPNDFNNLIKWSNSVPQPRFQTGTCVYNNESGAEVANCFTRSYFINASKELETLLDEVSEFANMHSEKMDEHELRIFRSDELPRFSKRVLASRHLKTADKPREVGVYLGESIAIAPCHVYVPLTKDSNNNILIIGGEPKVAKGIAYHSMLSEISAHTEKTCNVILMNFMMEDDPMQGLFKSDMFASVTEYCNIKEVKGADDVEDYLRFVKDNVIDARKNDPSLPLGHFYINIFEFQRGRMFDGTGSRGDMESECAILLEYILKNGPMVGVFTILHVDNLSNLGRLGYNAQQMFCHRIALQMPERDSDKIVGNSAANKLLVLNRPASIYRALYYNNVNNSVTKFKPYGLK